MKTKTSLASAAALSLIVFLSGCGVQDSAPNAEKTPQQKAPIAVEAGMEDPMQGEEISKADLEKLIFAKGFENQEYYRQLKESTQNAQMNIVQQEVFTSKSADACNKLPEISGKNCKNNFYISQAREKKDPKFCEKIESEDSQKYCKQDIIRQTARSTGDEKLCDSLEDKMMVQECKNETLVEAARRSGDTASCSKISEKFLKENCKQEAKFASEEKERMKKMEEEMKAIEAQTNNNVDTAPEETPAETPEKTEESPEISE